MSSITQAIAPPVVAPGATQTFSDAKVEDLTAKTNTDDKKKTDFRTLITNSMDSVIKERKAKENGDLSSSSDAEFLEKLADKSKEKRVPKNELGKDDFLKLFVTQLQNQDPMNPDDGTEMAAKLAQFNGLEQMMNVNKGIEKLISAQGNDRNMQMINYIGKEVTVDGGRVRLQNGVPTSSEFTTEVPVAAATLEVRDASGILVNQIDLGAMDVGNHALKWDGKTHDGRPAGDGVYTYSLNARNMDGGNVPISLSSKARITGVDVKSTDGSLFSDFGRVTFDQIRSVGKPGYDAVETPKAMAGAPAALPGEINVPIPGATPAASPPAGLSPAAPVQQAEKPKTPATPAAESLDKLQAEGKLGLKKAGDNASKSAEAAASGPGTSPKSAATRSGATASQPVPTATVTKDLPPEEKPAATLGDAGSPVAAPPAS